MGGGGIRYWLHQGEKVTITICTRKDFSLDNNFKGQFHIKYSPSGRIFHKRIINILEETMLYYLLTSLSMMLSEFSASVGLFHHKLFRCHHICIRL